jgi:hypothetical protein
LEGNVVEEIIDFPECTSVKLNGYHQDVVGLSAAFLILAPPFFLGFTVAGFLVLGVFEADVTLFCLLVSVTG